MRPRLEAVFAKLVEVLAVDWSLLRLHHTLEPFYLSVRTHHTNAPAKLGNPVIVRSHRPEHRHLKGRKLRDARHLVGLDTLDVEGETGYILKRQMHKHDAVRFRFVTLYKEELG